VPEQLILGASGISLQIETLGGLCLLSTVTAPRASIEPGCRGSAPVDAPDHTIRGEKKERAVKKFTFRPVVPTYRVKTVSVRPHVRVTLTRGVQLVRYHLRSKPR
jgi:hypothetical protein